MIAPAAQRVDGHRLLSWTYSTEAVISHNKPYLLVRVHVVGIGDMCFYGFYFLFRKLCRQCDLNSLSSTGDRGLWRRREVWRNARPPQRSRNSRSSGGCPFSVPRIKA